MAVCPYCLFLILVQLLASGHRRRLEWLFIASGCSFIKLSVGLSTWIHEAAFADSLKVKNLQDPRLGIQSTGSRD